jgi:FAD/FMN-containing dehydrogenase
LSAARSCFRTRPRARRTARTAPKHGSPADLVVLPGSTREISQLAKLCDDERIPIVPRGAGTGYTGGAVPTRGGVVLSLERMNRILEIDRLNLLARVQPNVITGDLQDAVEKVGLFYPPDPASLRLSALGGNVAECAGGPRAFKYGTTKRYVLALEAVLANGEIIPYRVEGREERRWIRSHPTACRLRGHARHHHGDHAAAHSEATRTGDAARRVFDDRERGGRRDEPDSSSRRAGGNRVN